MTILRAGSATDAGQVRSVNQDAAYTGTTLFAVADGMGGHAGGEVASATALGVLESAEPTIVTAEALRGAFASANRAVLAAADKDSSLRGMGTTLVVAGLVSEGGSDVLVLANVGDSRGYHFHEGVLRQLTDDHSMAAELLRQGDITAEEAARHPQRHVITRAIGIEGDPEVDLFVVPLGEGDRVLLCSDGLTNELDDEEIARVLDRIADPAMAAEDLVRRANAAGGADNITVVVVDAMVADEPPPPEKPVVEEDPRPTGAMPLATAAAGTTRPATPAPPEEGEGWIARRRRMGAPRVLTLRAVLFVLLLAGILAGAWFFLRWYATSSYYVTSEGDSIVIYQGRPGGVLWFQPRLVTVAPTPLSQVLPTRRPALAGDVIEPSLSAARSYVANLADEYQRTKAAQPAAPTTTAPPPPPTSPPPINGAPLGSSTTLQVTSSTVPAG